MVIFHSYVSLPEGNYLLLLAAIRSRVHSTLPVYGPKYVTLSTLSPTSTMASEVSLILKVGIILTY